MNWIVVPVRNSLHFTKGALPTFLAQDIGNVRVLLLDNDSTDGTGAWARAQNDVLYWHRRPPLSVAASWNLCLKWLFGEQRQERVLVSNNDVLLRPDTYRLLVEDGGQFVTATGVNSLEQMNQTPEPWKKRPNPDFSCFVIRKECYQKVGPMDESYAGGYVEDCDYHVRMHRAGVLAHSIGLPFLHYASGTIKSATPEEQNRIQKAAEVNRKRFFDKYGCYPGTKEYEGLFTTRPSSEASYWSVENRLSSATAGTSDQP